MKYVLIPISLLALALLGCQGEREISSIVNADLPTAQSAAKNYDPNSLGAQRGRAIAAKWGEAWKMSRDPAKYEEAETRLKELLQSDPGWSASYYQMLGCVYQRMGKPDKSVEAFRKYLDLEKGGEITGDENTSDWYAMYQAFKATGNEMDSRKVVREIMEKQQFDPSITYTDTSAAPSATVLRIVEAEGANSMLGYAAHEIGVSLLEEVAKKDGLTPKMMSVMAFTLRGVNRKEAAIPLLWKVYRSNSPKLSEEAKSDLIQLGEMKSEDGPGRRLN